jgi:biopolymer transport protein ExbD
MQSWDEQPELNITPLVDIMLVLLAIMMVIAPTIVFEERISLPDGSKKNSVVKHHPIEIVMDKKRAIFIKKDRFEYAAFPDTFRLFSSSFARDTTIMILADKSLRYQDVMWILKSVKAAGFTQVSLATDG